VKSLLGNIKKHLFTEIEYPGRYTSGSLFKTVSIQFFSLFLFLLLFRPFGVYEPEHKVGYVFICLLHALSPSVIIYLYFRILGSIINQPSRKGNWSASKEYLHLSIVFLLIGLASFLLRAVIYTNANNWSACYLWEEIRNCFLAGILFYFLLLFASSYIKINKASNQAIENSDLGVDTAVAIADELQVLSITTQVQQDNFSLVPSQLLFAKAEGNYTELTFCINDVVVTELKRISLKEFEGQLRLCTFLLRCHRSYLVNTLQINKVSGNAQGYQLTMNNTPETVPVSRAQLEAFNAVYNMVTGLMPQ
jgi:hypothetical protein